MPFPDYEAITEEHMQTLKPGDRFSEMLSYWVWIETVDEFGVVALTTHAGPDSKWERKVWPSVEAFKESFAYGTIPGYSLHWVDNKAMA